MLGWWSRAQDRAARCKGTRDEAGCMYWVIQGRAKSGNARACALARLDAVQECTESRNACPRNLTERS